MVGLLPVPEPLFYLHAQKHGGRIGFCHCFITLQEGAGTKGVILQQIKSRQLIQRGRIFRVVVQRRAQIVLGIVPSPVTPRTRARVGQHHFTGFVKRIAHCAAKQLIGFPVFTLTAQKCSVGVKGGTIVGRQAGRLSVMPAGHCIATQLLLNQGQRDIGRHMGRIQTNRALELFDGDFQITPLKVTHTQAGVQVCAAHRAYPVHSQSPVFTRMSATAAGCNAACHKQANSKKQHGGTQSLDHGGESACLASCCCMVSRRWLGDSSLPTSWPQAASMSWPRVLRTVVTRPAARVISLKRSMASSDEHLNGGPGNGLNGIRLILHGSTLTRRTRARACSGWSLTPSIMVYSKVILRLWPASTKRLQAAISSSTGYLRLSGTRRLRTSFSAACSDTASANSTPSARASMPGMTPAVDTVTRRAPRP